MKIISFLLACALFSCGNDSQSQAPPFKNAKPGNLQFFETYSFSEIASSWENACKWVHEHDSLATKENLTMTENPQGLNALVRPHTNFMVGYVKAEDRMEVEGMLALPEVKAKFPKDLRFFWSYGVEEVQNHHKMLALYAVKIPQGDKATINGKHIETVETAIADYNGMPVIRISMSDQGAHDWEVMTRKNIGRAIAITLDDHVLSCPVVNDAIAGGKTEISGNFTTAQAEELTARISAGRK